MTSMDGRPDPGPPNPDEVRSRLAAERNDQLIRAMKLIKQEVLPYINAVLRSSVRLEFEALGLVIEGNEQMVSISRVDGEFAWVEPLMSLLRQALYGGYTVGLWGHHFEKPKGTLRSLPLAGSTVAIAIQIFLAAYKKDGGYLEVRISLYPQ